MLRKPQTHLLLILVAIALYYTRGGTTVASPDKAPSKAAPSPQASGTPRGVEHIMGLALPPTDVEILSTDGAQAVVRFDMREHKRLMLVVELSQPSREWSLNLGDSPTNNGWAGDSGSNSNDAELQIKDGILSLYGSDAMGEGNHLIKSWTQRVEPEQPLTLEISDGRLAVTFANGETEVVEHPALFALSGQPDQEGSTNYDLYLGVNRTVSPGRTGSGVSGVKASFL